MSGISREELVNKFFVSCRFQSVLIIETPLSVGIFIAIAFVTVN